MVFYAGSGPKIKAVFTVLKGEIDRVCLSISDKDCLSWEVVSDMSSGVLENKISCWMLAYSRKEAAPDLLPLAFSGGISPFTRTVLERLKKIPFGSFLSYQEISSDLHRGKGARAVGGACGRNPFPLVIPCHRVLAKGGSLGGFSCGLPIKEMLLRHEGIEYC